MYEKTALFLSLGSKESIKEANQIINSAKMPEKRNKLTVSIR